MNIGRADQLGSGIRNLYKYTKLYSGREPELIEGDIFKTIIPLVLPSEKQAKSKRITSRKQANNTSEKQANNTSEKQANKTGEKKRVIVSYLERHGKVTVAELTQIMNISAGRIRAILLEMAREGQIVKVGQTKSAHYVLR